jgi:hypothetical protein
MKVARTFLSFSVLFVFSLGREADHKQNRPVPSLTLDIRTLGFIPITQRDWEKLDKGILKTNDVRSLESDDPHVQVSFISNDTAVVSWTRGPNSEPRWEDPLFLTGVFVDTKTGVIKYRQEWPTHKRRRNSNLADTEGRILPVSNGRFIVHANGGLQLYSSDFRPSQSHELPTDGGYSSVKVLTGGERLFLRHESPMGIYYSWLNVDDFQSLRSEPAPQRSLDFDPRNGVLPFDDGFYTVVGKSLQAIPAITGPTIVCEPSLCRNNAFTLRASILDQQRVALLGSEGVAVYTHEAHPIWSKIGTGVRNGFDVTESLNGHRVAVRTFGEEKNGTFEGHPLAEGPNYFIYESDRPDLLFFVRPPREWEAGDALSPDGTKFAVLSGTQLQIYEVPLMGTSQK